MTNYPLSAFGPNPNAGRNANNALDWGPYQWPGGVPANLMGTARHPDHSDAYFQTRKELIELLQTLMHYAHTQGYRIYGMNNGEFWGPWGYQNRAISGTSSPSNHSRAKALDINAPWNPQSYTFITNLPPAVVNAFETCGFYWGGRYTGGTKYDTMHFEYCWKTTDVPAHLARAQSLCGGSTPIPEPEPEPIPEDDDMVQLVQQGETGWLYAVAPLCFQAVDGERADWGIAPGVYKAPVPDKPLNYIQLAELRDRMFGGKGTAASASGLASAIPTGIDGAGNVTGWA